MTRIRRIAVSASTILLLWFVIKVGAVLTHETTHALQAAAWGDSNITLLLNPTFDPERCLGSPVCEQSVGTEDPGGFWWGEGLPSLLGWTYEVSAWTLAWSLRRREPQAPPEDRIPSFHEEFCEPLNRAQDRMGR